MIGVFLPAIVIAYFVGAIPFAQVIAKFHGKDLRTIGSGSPVNFMASASMG